MGGRGCTSLLHQTALRTMSSVPDEGAVAMKSRASVCVVHQAVFKALANHRVVEKEQEARDTP